VIRFASPRGKTLSEILLTSHGHVHRSSDSSTNSLICSKKLHILEILLMLNDFQNLELFKKDRV